MYVLLFDKLATDNGVVDLGLIYVNTFLQVAYVNLTAIGLAENQSTVDVVYGNIGSVVEIQVVVVAADAKVVVECSIDAGNGEVAYLITVDTAQSAFAPGFVVDSHIDVFVVAGDDHRNFVHV